jgi:cob(I)alamin adenosyltransferase
MRKLEKGFIQIYTGNGKGKTTAAIGQAVRAAGCGLKTLIIHFMKDFPYSELKSLKLLQEFITVEQYGNDTFVLMKTPPDDNDKFPVLNALQRVKEVFIKNEFDIIILDELCVTFYFRLLTIEDVLPVIDLKPDNMELIITGRYCPQELIEKADLVTEMKEIKHYYQKGITSRKGIEC